MTTQYFETEEEMDDAFENIMERMQDEARERDEEERAAAKENTLTVIWELRIECPKCGEELDLANGPHDDDGCFSVPIFNNHWDSVKGMKVTCDECGFEFEIHDVES